MKTEKEKINFPHKLINVIYRRINLIIVSKRNNQN